MVRGAVKEGVVIELSRDILKKMPLKDGDLLLVRLIDGKEIVLEKPRNDYWDKTFTWGKEFAKTQKITPKDIEKAIKDVRLGLK